MRIICDIIACLGWDWNEIEDDDKLRHVMELPKTTAQDDQLGSAALLPLPAAQMYKPDIAALAKLSPIEYDQARKAEAKKADIRVETLDAEVDAMRAKSKPTQSKGIRFDDVEPWSEPVNAAELLDDIKSALKRFIVCDDATATAATLWIAETWLVDRVQVAPLAIITAPEKRCGKSQLLDFVGRLVLRPLVASNISTAALFRVIEAHCPTLLIDECDTFMRDNDELRGVINSGHTRTSAYVIRTTGDAHEPTQFSTWGFKALCGIGALPETIMDRGIVLELRRKLPHEHVQRMRRDTAGLFSSLKSRLARFAQDSAVMVARQTPSLPESLNDRAQDNWEELLKIACFAGNHWPETARAAALAINAEKEQAQSIGVELLRDIQGVFAAKHTVRISTADLLEALIRDDELSWATYNRGKSINAKQLAKQLGEFGIKSKDIKALGQVKKSFELAQFADAFSRYLSPCAEILPLPATETQKSPPLKGFVENLAATAAATIRYPLPDTVAANDTGSATENVPATRNPLTAGLVAGSGKFGSAGARHIEVTL